MEYRKLPHGDEEISVLGLAWAEYKTVQIKK